MAGKPVLMTPASRFKPEMVDDWTQTEVSFLQGYALHLNAMSLQVKNRKRKVQFFDNFISS